ncbi:MAG: ABC transporter permease subunit [Eubacteriales bacterium]
MFSKTYFKQTVKSNFKLWLIFTGVLCALICVVLSVFDADTLAQLGSNSANMPINPLGDISTLINLLANQYFGMFCLIFPMIYIIITGNKLISGQVDNGNMAYNLSAPISRIQIAGTSMLYLAGSLTLMYGLIVGIGCGAAEILQPGELDLEAFCRLALGSYLLQLAISAISFCASCIFNRSSRSLLFGAGLPLVFYGANLLAGLSKDLKFFKYFSLITLFDKAALIAGEGYSAGLAVLAVISVVIYTAGITVFKKKDLPL